MRIIRLMVCLIFLGGMSEFSQSAAAAGNIRLLIARPNYFDYTTDVKTMWISSVTESFLYFRLDAIDKLKVVPIDEISAKVSSHRNYEKRVGKSKYLSAGKELLATHVLYIEYEVRGKEVKLHFTVDAPDKSLKSQKTQAVVSLGDMNTALTDAVREIATMIGVSKSELPEAFYSINILGTQTKNTKRLGDYLVNERKGDKNTLGINAGYCEKITKSDYSMYLAYYAGSRLYAKAGKNQDALRLTQALVDKLEDRYPKLNLQLATYFRKSGQLSQAKSAIDRLGRNPNLKHVALLEKALIYAAMGNHSTALQSFKSLQAVSGKDPFVYMQLARMSLALNQRTAADGYVKKAAGLSGKSAGKIYCEIGAEFTEAKDGKNALVAYRQGTRIEPDNTDAWLGLGNMQVKAQQDSAAAISYLQLFKLDYMKYGDYLEKAGLMLEKKGMKKMAREVYMTSYEKTGDPKIAILLATLEFNAGNLRRVKELLEPLGSPYSKDQKVISMLEKATEDKIPPKLELLGANPMTIKPGKGTYIEPGATAIDNVDGDMTVAILISGKVRSNHLGTYTITYKVLDGSKNVSTKTRTVIVSDDDPPTLELTGPAQIKLMAGEQYQEQGARGHDSREGNISSRVIITGTVNTKVPGTYTLTYIVKDASGNSSTPQKRTVIVARDSAPPKITLIGGDPMHLDVGESYSEPGAMAKDVRDGNLSSRIVIRGTVNTQVIGSYKITYSVKDQSGNMAKAERMVNVKEPEAPIDNVRPVIRLIGGSPNTIYVGDPYEEPGVNATDDVDGDITAFINIEGEIDPSQSGTYYLKYSVADKSGNKTEKELRVRVRSRGRQKQVSRIDQTPRQQPTQKTPDFMSTTRNKSRSKRKPVLAILSGLGTIGGFGLGLIFNSQATSHQNDWLVLREKWEDATGDEKKELKSQMDDKANKGNTSALLRTLSYAGSGVCGVTLVINIIVRATKY